MAVRKLSVISLTILLAVLIILPGCGGSGVSPTPTPTAAPAVKLVFTTQPTEAKANVPFDPQPVVAVEDEEGNIATGYKGLVVLTITAGTGTSGAQMWGGTKLALTNGVVKFKDLYIDKAGSAYTLTAICGNLSSATSKPFTVLPGPPAKLIFSIQPSGGVAGSPLTTQPEVTVQDAGGNTVTGYEGSVTLAITYGSGTQAAVLSGTTTVHVINSTAQFTDLSINRTSPEYTLTATSPGLVSAKSRIFQISAAAPTKLEFTVQLEGAKAGEPFETQPKVAVMDIYGNVVTSSRASITVSITPDTGTAGAILSGTKTLVAEDAMGGLSAFVNLSIDRAGSGYTLTATSAGLTSATSAPFDVTPSSTKATSSEPQ